MDFTQSSLPTLTPPRAEVQDECLTHLGRERIDPFYYMRDKEDPRVLEYLRAENAYTAEVMASMHETEEQIFKEIVGRIKEDDQSYPTLRRGYYYYARTEKGKQYPSYYRVSEADFVEHYEQCPTAIEGGELLFDVNALAEGHDAYIFAGYAVSPNSKLAAYFANTTGSYAEFDLHIRDLERGEDLAFTLSGVSSLAWAEDSETVYYTLIDETLRSTKAFAQRLTDAEPTLIYEEQDVRFSCSVSETKTREYIFLTAGSSTTTEEYYLSSDGSDRTPKLFLPREQDVRYSILSHREKLSLIHI